MWLHKILPEKKQDWRLQAWPLNTTFGDQMPTPTASCCKIPSAWFIPLENFHTFLCDTNAKHSMVGVSPKALSFIVNGYLLQVPVMTELFPSQHSARNFLPIHPLPHMPGSQ